MPWPDTTNWSGAIARAIDDLLFGQAPSLFGRYLMSAPTPALIALLVLVSGVVVYMTLWPTQKGDVANVGIVLVYNMAVKAVTGICILAFYGSVFGLMAIGIMRLLP